MPINTSPRSTSLSSMSEPQLDLMSDGKRMRAVWKPEHGDGDSTGHIIERCKNTVRGHPTWKIFIDDVPQPIVRGSAQEPPHYTYLDDRACYAVWESKLYTDAELKKYWPYDFDHQGNIKSGRPNRGHAAWTQGPSVELAKGKLRGKDNWYEFSGAPNVTEYKPLRPVTKTKMELLVEAERAAKKAREAAGSTEVPKTPAQKTSAETMTTPGGTPITNSNEASPVQVDPRKARLEKVCNLIPSPPRHARNLLRAPTRPVSASSPLNGTNEHAASTYSSQGPSCDDASGDTGTILDAASSPKNPEQKTPTSKRKTVGPFLLSSSSPTTASDSPEHKRPKLVNQRQSSLPVQLLHKSGSSSPIEECVSRGERPSSLPPGLSEPVLEVGGETSSEDEDFLARIGKAFKDKH